MDHEVKWAVQHFITPKHVQPGGERLTGNVCTAPGSTKAPMMIILPGQLTWVFSECDGTSLIPVHSSAGRCTKVDVDNEVAGL